MANRLAISSPIPAEMMQKMANDQSQDANFALMELEKGLRSGKVGEQCEAIVCVPALLEKYPFPILVNAAFLKLADVFRAGTNFMKLCVLKALQSSKKHLNKILNVDEFSRRFFAVIHSNDPIARAVTLRVFGNISPIIADKKNIHHSIRNSLDSHDEVEVEAAIFATRCFTEQSKSFAEGIWQKIAEMIRGLSTPMEMKLKLITIFQHMSYDIEIANEIQAIGKELLQSYQANDFVVTILNTLTQLATVTLVNIPHQINLLLEYLKLDPRKSVQSVAVKNLHQLARKALQLWDENHVNELAAAALGCFDSELQQDILSVVCVLSAASGTSKIFSSSALDTLEEFTNSMDTETASLALESVVSIITSREDCNTLDKLVTDVQTHFAMSVADQSVKAVKRCAKCCKNIFQRSATDGMKLTTFFLNTMKSLSDDLLIEVAHALVSLGTHSRHLLFGQTQFLINLMNDHVNDEERVFNSDAIVALATLTLQSMYNMSMDEYTKMESQMHSVLSVLDQKEQFWTVFKIGRQAARLAHPGLSSKLFANLCTKVASENLFFWLKALANFQGGEAKLMTEGKSMEELRDMLNEAHNCYQEGLANLKAAVTTDHPLYFQYKYARLRADMLRAYSQLLTCCSSLKLSPPPAIAMATSIATGQEVHHLSRMASQFQSCAHMFSGIANGYQHLHTSSFNADRTSLATIQMLQESCQLLAYAIESLISHRTNEKLSPDFSGSSVESKRRLSHYLCQVADTNLKILEKVEEIYNDSKDAPVSHTQVNWLTTSVSSLLRTGLSYPLYFFKSLQQTNIQLSVSPGNASPADPYTVNIAHEMVLKVEGVVVNLKKNCSFRSVQKVNVVVKQRLLENLQSASNELKMMQPSEVILRDSNTPQNDYFSVQFLLSFKSAGRYFIRISTNVTDELGVDWETGPHITVYVDAYEQGHYKKK